MVARFSVLRRPGRARARSRDQRGAVVVEFALIVPLLLLLVFGILEFGYMMSRDTAIDNAARDGARVASLDGTFSDVCTAVKSELSGSGIPAPTTCNASASTTTANIKIDCIKADGSACAASSTTFDTLSVSGATATVRVSYSYKWITPLISSLFGSTASLDQYTQMRVE
ncbi:MAG: pilus assembly protein [Marmoricola sp.]|jgi:Flp pilus assembly protein TadG|nr:pilus assembly protein [Marmoricola sp.]